MWNIIIAAIIAYLVYRAFRYKGQGMAIVWGLGAFILSTIIVPIFLDQLSAGAAADASEVTEQANDTSI